MACRLKLDVAGLGRLGLQLADVSQARLTAPAIAGFQPSGSWEASAKLTVQGKGSGYNVNIGWNNSHVTNAENPSTRKAVR